MKSGIKLNPSEAAYYVNEWIRKAGYGQIFKNDVSLLMSDNRRVSRSSNVIKFGRIDFDAKPNGRITYDLQDIQDFTQRLKVICNELDAIRSAKATKAASTARKVYEMVKVSDRELDQLLSEVI